MRRTSSDDSRIVIVGGGVVGLLASWYLVKAGFSPIVADRAGIGRESSWAGGGILAPLYPARYEKISTLVATSAREYPQIVREAMNLSGVDSEYDRKKLIVLDETAGGHRIDRAQLMSIEPTLELTSDGATVYDSAVIRNPRFIRSLRTALIRLGVQFCETSEVTGFGVRNGHLDHLTTSNGKIEASRCLLATGAWTDVLLKTTGLSLGIRPMKGQMLAVETEPGLLSNIIVQKYRYLIPRRDGLVLVGSTLEEAGFNKEPTAVARAELWDAALRLVPRLKRYSIRYHWAGLRPGSPDDAPFIGEHPAIKGIFVCAGHFRNGFATGPASAKLVVDMMLCRELAADAKPYCLTRFN